MSFRFDLVADYSSLYLFLFLGGFIVFTAFFEWLTEHLTHFTRVHDEKNATVFGPFITAVHKELAILGMLSFGSVVVFGILDEDPRTFMVSRKLPHMELFSNFPPVL